MKLKIKMTKHDPYSTEVFIDGKKPDGLCGLDFNLNADGAPMVNLRMHLEEIDIEANDFKRSVIYYSTEKAKHAYDADRKLNLCKRTMERILDADGDGNKVDPHSRDWLNIALRELNK